MNSFENQPAAHTLHMHRDGTDFGVLKQALLSQSHSFSIHHQPAHVERTNTHPSTWSPHEMGNHLIDRAIAGDLSALERFTHEYHIYQHDLSAAYHTATITPLFSLYSTTNDSHPALPLSDSRSTLLDRRLHILNEKIHSRELTRVYGPQDWVTYSWSLAGQAINKLYHHLTSPVLYTFSFKLLWSSHRNAAYMQKITQSSTDNNTISPPAPCPFSCCTCSDSFTHTLFACPGPDDIFGLLRLDVALQLTNKSSTLPPRLAAALLHLTSLITTPRPSTSTSDSRFWAGLLHTDTLDFLLTHPVFGLSPEELTSLIFHFTYITIPAAYNIWRTYCTLTHPTTTSTLSQLTTVSRTRNNNNFFSNNNNYTETTNNNIFTTQHDDQQLLQLQDPTLEYDYSNTNATYSNTTTVTQHSTRYYNQILPTATGLLTIPVRGIASKRPRPKPSRRRSARPPTTAPRATQLTLDAFLPPSLPQAAALPSPSIFPLHSASDPPRYDAYNLPIHATSESEAISALALHLHSRPIDVPGDGNCMTYAVQYILYLRTPTEIHPHGTLINDAIAFLRTHPVGTVLLLDHYTSPDELHSLIPNTHRSEEGSAILLAAFAYLHNLEIHVHYLNTPHINAVTTGTEVFLSPHAQPTHLHLLNHANHYQILLPHSSTDPLNRTFTRYEHIQGVLSYPPATYAPPPRPCCAPLLDHGSCDNNTCLNHRSHAISNPLSNIASFCPAYSCTPLCTNQESEDIDTWPVAKLAPLFIGSSSHTPISILPTLYAYTAIAAASLITPYHPDLLRYYTLTAPDYSLHNCSIIHMYCPSNKQLCAYLVALRDIQLNEPLYCNFQSIAPFCNSPSVTRPGRSSRGDPPSPSLISALRRQTYAEAVLSLTASSVSSTPPATPPRSKRNTLQPGKRKTTTPSIFISPRSPPFSPPTKLRLTSSSPKHPSQPSSLLTTSPNSINLTVDHPPGTHTLNIPSLSSSLYTTSNPYSLLSMDELPVLSSHPPPPANVILDPWKSKQLPRMKKAPKQYPPKKRMKMKRTKTQKPKTLEPLKTTLEPLLEPSLQTIPEPPPELYPSVPIPQSPPLCPPQPPLSLAPPPPLKKKPKKTSPPKQTPLNLSPVICPSDPQSPLPRLRLPSTPLPYFAQSVPRKRTLQEYWSTVPLIPSVVGTVDDAPFPPKKRALTLRSKPGVDDEIHRHLTRRPD